MKAPVEHVEAKKKREEEIADIEKFIAERGVTTKRPRAGKGEEDEFDDEDEELAVVVPRKKIVTKPIKEAVQMKKKIIVKKPVVETTTTKEVIRTKGQAFGSEGRMFDMYAVPLPEDIKTLKQLKDFLRETKGDVIEFRDGELRVYNVDERITSSGRVAKRCLKKCGDKIRTTFRSNVNSRVVE